MICVCVCHCSCVYIRGQRARVGSLLLPWAPGLKLKSLGLHRKCFIYGAACQFPASFRYHHWQFPWVVSYRKGTFSGHISNSRKIINKHSRVERTLKTREMAQWVECLLYKQEDLILDPQQLYKDSVQWPRAGQEETGRTLAFASQPVWAKWWVVGSMRKPCLKNDVDNDNDNNKQQ